MALRPNNLDTVMLVLEMLKRIPRGNKISAPELTRQLEDAGLKRDIRTIQRQLDELSQRFDIERDDRSKPYGYRWKDQAQGLSLPNLNESESLLLALAEQHLAHLLPAPLLRSMSGFFSQARKQLDPRQPQAKRAKRERDWLKKVRVISTTQPMLAPTIKAGVLEAVSTALFGNSWLEVDYKNAQDKQTQARVMPLGLAQQGVRLFLVCRFDGYANERSLALHRIQSAQNTQLSFTPPPEFDLQQFDDDGRFGFGEGKKIALSFWIEALHGKFLLETPLSSDQVATPKTRKKIPGYGITATVTESAQLTWWLRGFGDAVQDVKRG